MSDYIDTQDAELLGFAGSINDGQDWLKDLVGVYRYINVIEHRTFTSSQSDSRRVAITVLVKIGNKVQLTNK